jgi:hypothetical protein
MLHLLVLGAAGICSWPAAGLVGKFEPARLLVSLVALWKARPEDVPAVMEWAAKWQGPGRVKRR